MCFRVPLQQDRHRFKFFSTNTSFFSWRCEHIATQRPLSPPPCQFGVTLAKLPQVTCIGSDCQFQNYHVRSTASALSGHTPPNSVFSPHPSQLPLVRNFMEVKSAHSKARAGFCSLTPTIHRPWMNTVVPWMNTVVDWTGGCLECLFGCNDFVHNTACTWRIIQPSGFLLVARCCWRPICPFLFHLKA